MADTSLKELQHAELDILKEFVRICNQFDLQYYLGWGSCLGAVRHQGFIPWDDDIDVLMPANDYEKFKEVCKDALNKNYFYQDRETDPNYFLNFAKLRSNDTTFMLEAFSKIDIHWGINIDIFPLYETKSATISEKYKNDLLLYRKIAYKFAYTKRKFYKTASLKEKIKVFGRCVWYHCLYPENKRLKQIEAFEKDLRLCQGDYYIDSENVDVLGPLAKNIFGKGKTLTFEDMQVKVPEDYDTYLKSVYGEDYMVVPQEGSDKIYHHEDVIIDIHQSYIEYKNKL